MTPLYIKNYTNSLRIHNRCSKDSNFRNFRFQPIDNTVTSSLNVHRLQFERLRYCQLVENERYKNWNLKEHISSSLVVIRNFYWKFLKFQTHAEFSFKLRLRI